MKRIPKAGDQFTTDDFDMVLEAYEQRQRNFPNEPASFTFALVLFNIGDRFTPVECIEQEWAGLKKDVPKSDGVPKCPNGHVLVQGLPLKLGWIQERD